jgi:hypothetical protein
VLLGIFFFDCDDDDDVIVQSRTSQSVGSFQALGHIFVNMKPEVDDQKRPNGAGMLALTILCISCLEVLDGIRCFIFLQTTDDSSSFLFYFNSLLGTTLCTTKDRLFSRQTTNNATLKT